MRQLPYNNAGQRRMTILHISKKVFHITNVFEPSKRVELHAGEENDPHKYLRKVAYEYLGSEHLKGVQYTKQWSSSSSMLQNSKIERHSWDPVAFCLLVEHEYRFYIAFFSSYIQRLDHAN
jgi:hypothetical protein